MAYTLALLILLSPWESYSKFVSLSFFLSKMEILPPAYVKYPAHDGHQNNVNSSFPPSFPGFTSPSAVANPFTSSFFSGKFLKGLLAGRCY